MNPSGCFGKPVLPGMQAPETVDLWSSADIFNATETAPYYQARPVSDETHPSIDPEVWKRVDDYLETSLLQGDPVLDAAQEDSQEAGLPAISVSPLQGCLLQLLARSIGARRILEIGTLGGYSTIWMARALPADGALVTLEIDPKHAAVANANIARAGLADKVDLRLGAALETLPQLERESAVRFDLAFIDADKQNIPAYFEWSLRLVRRGGIIVVDNVVRHGEVINETSSDTGVPGVRELFRRLRTEDRVTATTIQTVGVKGYDGLVIAVVN